MSQLVVDLRWCGTVQPNSLAAVARALESHPYASALILRPSMTLRPDGGDPPWSLLLGEADSWLRQQLLVKPHDELIFSPELTFPDMDPFFAVFNFPGMSPGPELWIEPDSLYNLQDFLRVLANDIPQDQPARIRLLVSQPCSDTFLHVLTDQPGSPQHIGIVSRFTPSLLNPSIRLRTAAFSPLGRFLGYEIIPLT
jgi:hypothetical protein